MKKSASSFLIDTFLLCSLVGIYPRFIEPKMLNTTKLSFPFGPKLTIVHLSDLHFNKGTSPKFLAKVSRRVRRLKPDLILFTGDFLCYSRVEEEERLTTFLQSLHAKLGCYCIFGNHDYEHYVSRTKEGTYDLLPPPSPGKGFLRGLRTLFTKAGTKGDISPKASSVQLNEHLCTLLSKTPFQLLENDCVTLPCGLNIVGLGDYGLGRCRPETAFAGYQKKFPGIILSHNPDTFPILKKFPGDLILSGHSHGEQLHFPAPFRFVSRKLTRLENPHLSRGKYEIDGKTLYVNRGLGCHKPVRFCSIPELTVIYTGV